MLKMAETPAEMQKDFEELDFYQQVCTWFNLLMHHDGQSSCCVDQELDMV